MTQVNDRLDGTHAFIKELMKYLARLRYIHVSIEDDGEYYVYYSVDCGDPSLSLEGLLRRVVKEWKRKGFRKFRDVPEAELKVLTGYFGKLVAPRRSYSW